MAVRLRTPDDVQTPTDASPGWVRLTAAAAPVPPVAPAVSTRRVLVHFAATMLGVLLLLGLTAFVATRILAERETIADGRQTADLLAQAVVEPQLTPQVLAGNPGALATLDHEVRRSILTNAVLRLKLFTADGRVVYSDEPRLIGRSFVLDRQELDALSRSRTQVTRTTAQGAENEFEEPHGQLLEVRRRVASTTGTPLLFEAYFDYDIVRTRAESLWRTAMLLESASLALFGALTIPIMLRLVRSVRSAHERHADLLRQAMTASVEERRRIAGNLHEGPVQELSAAHLVVSAVGSRLEREGHPALAEQARSADAGIRGSIAALRSLLVEVYPPNLDRTGLERALTGLVASVAARGTSVRLELDPESEHRLDSAQRQLIYRVARECIRNASAHARAKALDVVLRPESDADVLLEIRDNGRGFDLNQALVQPREGHIGLPALIDLVGKAGLELCVSTRPGRGTRYRLRVPAPRSVPDGTKAGGHP